MSPPAPPIVRAFEQRDIPAVLDLWERSEGLGHGPGDSAADLARFLARNPGISPVATADDGPGAAVVGAALCGHDGRRGFLYRLSVARERRRAGLATALVRHALAALRAEGIPRCMLFVLAENDGAAQFWESVGAAARVELRLRSIDLPSTTTDPGSPA